MKKKKILYISSIIPDTSCGAHLAIYRHLVLNHDFEVVVASSYVGTIKTLKTFQIEPSGIFKRIANSRFSRVYYNVRYFLNWITIPPALKKFALTERPDIVFMVPDNFHSGWGVQLAKKLKIPLVVDFQDLFPISNYISEYMKPYGFMRRYLSNRFDFLNANADYVFYTSIGMKNYFPAKQSSAVLHPMGDFEPEMANSDFMSAGNDFTILYAGNCYGAYGRMLLRLAKVIEKTPGIHLRIFPVGRGWSDDDITFLRNAGIYQSFLPFSELRKELRKADALLTVMSFEESEIPFVTTSFTTKWLDYVKFGKPIISWSPSYSSSSVFANSEKCAVIIDKDDPEFFVNTVLSVSVDEWKALGAKSLSLAQKEFNPNHIHNIFVSGINAALKGIS